VQKIIAEQLAMDKEKITPNSKFVDLGADSLDTVEIMMALEEKFEIQLDAEKGETIKTVQDAVGLIEETVKLSDVIHFNLDDPSLAIRIAVDEFGVLFVSEGFVDFEDFTCNRHEQFGGGLHGLNGAKFFLGV
jgi:acyl carrier protein